MTYPQKLAYVSWINNRDATQTNWAMNYFLKKTKIITHNIWHLDTEIGNMEEYKRKSIVSGMRNAWRAMELRQNAKSGRFGQKKSAFNIFLNSTIFSAISKHCKIHGYTKAQYIENLVTNQISFESHYHTKFKELKSSKQAIALQNENIELKNNLDVAQRTIEELEKVIYEITNSISKEKNNTLPPPNSNLEDQTSDSVKAQPKLDDNPEVPHTSDKPHIRKLNPRKKLTYRVSGRD